MVRSSGNLLIWVIGNLLISFLAVSTLALILHAGYRRARGITARPRPARHSRAAAPPLDRRAAVWAGAPSSGRHSPGSCFSTRSDSRTTSS